MALFDGIEEFENVSPGIQWAIFIVGCLILLVALVAVVVSIWLSVKYITFNRRQNSQNISGGDAARKILDKNGLEHIKISTFGSIFFGNSYSHYFKKVRIRRFTKNHTSITSLAIGAEKSALAIMDKEGDKDMKHRIALTPLIYFGPVAFIPILAVGVLLDYLVFNLSGVSTLISAGLGILLYVISFVLSIKVLKTEVKAQKKACEILKKEGMATDEEIKMMDELFKLYNIQYVIDIIIELLQMIMKVLEVVAKFQNSSAQDINQD